MLSIVHGHFCKKGIRKYTYIFFSSYGQQTHLEEGNISLHPCLFTALKALCFCRASPHLINSSGDLFQVLPLIVSCP